MATSIPFTPTPTIVNASAFEGLSTGLDNAKQSRIRVVSGVIGAPNVVVYINGLPVSNGGRMQQNIGVGSFSGWVYVTPGTYTVALVPHGETVEQALFAPAAVDAEAGHRYTVAAMGQLKEKNVRPLVVDETALEGGTGPKATNAIYITINNLRGLEGLELRHDGKVLSSTEYGEANVAVCASYDRHFEEITAAEKPEVVLANANMWCHLEVSSAAIAYGDYPGNINISNDSQGTSEANVLEFLAEFNRHHAETDGGQVLTFNTLVPTIENAEMRDFYASDEPYYFLAPTDEAFAAMPKDQLDSLLGNSQELTKLLKTHLIKGYYPFGSISGTAYGRIDREVTNLLGQKLKMLDNTINKLEVSGPSFAVGNGNRLQVVDKLLPVK